MNRLLPLVLSLCSLFIATTGYSQVKYEKFYKPFEPIVIELDSKPADGIKQSVIWNANFEYKEATGILFGWAAPGDYFFTGTVFQTKAVKLGDETLEVLVGAPSQVKGNFSVVVPQPPEPTPVPPPDPVPPGPTPVPTPGNCDKVEPDLFNNLGQRSCGWATGLPKRNVLAEIYAKAAFRLLNDQTATAKNVGEQIMVERTAGLGTDLVKYKGFVDNINKELETRWPMDKATLADFFLAASKGLNGG